MAVQIPMDLHNRHTCTITRQGIGRPWTGSGGRMRQGRGEAPRAKPLERGGTRKANRALRLAPPTERERPKRQIERSGSFRQRNAKDPKGKSSVPARFASGTRKTRKANRAFRLVSPAERERPERQIERSVWLCQRNAKEKALPVQETRPSPLVPPAPPKEEPFDRGIGVRESA